MQNKYRMNQYSARAASTKTRPLPVYINVPTTSRHKRHHHIYWEHNHNGFKSDDMYNSIVEMFDSPDMRRWAEIRGVALYTRIPYTTSYNPPSVLGNPPNVWVLCDDKGELMCFTNVVEAWLTMLGMEQFEGIKCYIMHNIRRLHPKAA